MSSKQKQKWIRVSAACYELIDRGIKWGEVCRDIDGKWISVFRRKPLTRWRTRIEACHEVKLKLLADDGQSIS